MARLEIQLLGPFQATLDGEPITGFDSDKVRALLAYLAVESDRPARREKLAGLLWPDFAESSARTNLRQALTNLRRVLRDQAADPPFLLPTRQTIHFNRQSDHALDAGDFAALAAGQQGRAPEFEALEAAVALYRGSFMEGFSLPDSSAFEEWILINRESTRRQALRALHHLARFYEEKEAFEQALGFAHRQLELDPYQEAAHQQVMRLLAQSGQRNEALAHYEAYRGLLETELGVLPLEQTQTMYEQLQAGGQPGPAAATLILRREPRKVGQSPYRGLAAFREADAPFFFGREAFTQRLAQAVQLQTLVSVIVGPSGSGKSSTVFSGLLPQLRAQSNWLIAQCRPRGQPLQALAGALVPLLEPDLRETDLLIETEKLAAALDEGTLPLYQVVLRALEKNPRTDRLLLVVDQFEELYTLCPEPEARHRFLNILLAGAEAGSAQQRSPFVLVLTLRADFMSQALAHRPFADALQDSALILGPMNRAELRAAIAKPAERQGAAFEAGLVARILDDVGEEPGSLPLLEFALTLLWENLDQGWLTHQAYEDIGRVQGALARYAEETYAALDSSDRAQARRALIQLVQPGEGTEDTRRVATRTEFGEATWALLRHLADRRLVVTGSDEAGHETAEVVHEALIRGWERLQDWMAEDRAFRVWQERLRVGLRGWEDSARDLGALLRGVPLSEAEHWLVERPGELSAAEREFIQAGLEDRSRVEAAARAQEARERALEQAALRRLRTIVGVLIAASIMGITLTLAVFNQSRIASRTAEENVRIANTAQAASTQAVAQQILAEEERNRAEEEAIARATQQAIAEEQAMARATQQAIAEAEAAERAFQQALAERNEALARSLALAANARLALNAGETDLAIALALAANQIEGPPAQAQLALADAAYAPGTRAFLEGHAINRVYALFLLPGGQQALSGGVGRSIILWNLDNAQPIQRYGGFRGSVLSVDYSPEQEIAILGVLDGSLRVLDLATGVEIGRFLHSPPNVGAALSPDGRSALWLAENGQIVQIDLGDNTEIQRLGPPFEANPDGAVSALAYHPGGGQAISGHLDGSLRVWDLSRGQETQTLGGNSAPIEDLVILPDGGRALTANANGVVALWNLATGRLIKQWEPESIDDRVFRVAALADGERALLGTLSGGLLIWDLGSRAEAQRLGGPEDSHAGWVSALAPGADGRTAIAGDTSGGLILWDLETGLAIRRYEDESAVAFRSPVLDVDLSPDGLTFVSSLESGALALWDLESGEKIQRFDANDWNVESVALLPGGGSALATTINGGLVEWDWLQGTFTRLYEGPQARAVEAVWRPGSQEALSSSFNLTTDQGGDLVLWDLQRGVMRFRLQGAHETDVSTLAISPDGSRGLSGDDNGLIVLWNLDTGAAIRSLNTHSELVLDLAFSADGRLALSGSQDGDMILWDLEAGEALRRFPVALNAEAVALSPDGRIAYAGTSSGEVQLWDTETGTEIQVLAGHTNIIYDLVISPDGRVAISSAVDGVVRLWDLSPGAELGSLDWPAFQFGAALTSDGQYAYTGAGGDLLQWDLQSRELILQLTGHDQPIFDIVIGADGRRALSSAGDPFATDPTSLILWDLAAGEDIRRLEGEGQFYVPAFGPDGRYALVSSDGNNFPGMFLWDLETGETLNRFGMSPGEWEVGVLAVSPDGREALTGSLSDIQGDWVHRWDLESGDLLEAFPGHSFAVADLVYLPDGEGAVTASWDRSLILWDLKSGELERRMTGRNAEFFSVAVDPSGRFALAGTGDGLLILWDLETGEAVRNYSGHTGPVAHIAFSPEGDFAITNALDGTVRLWRIDRSVEALKQWLRENRYVRELTCDERARYQVEPLCGE